MEIIGDKIIFEGTPIATIDGGWPTLVERFSEILLNGAEEGEIENLKNEIEGLKEEIQKLNVELDEA